MAEYKLNEGIATIALQAPVDKKDKAVGILESTLQNMLSNYVKKEGDTSRPVGYEGTFNGVDYKIRGAPESTKNQLFDIGLFDPFAVLNIVPEVPEGAEEGAVIEAEKAFYKELHKALSIAFEEGYRSFAVINSEYQGIDKSTGELETYKALTRSHEEKLERKARLAGEGKGKVGNTAVLNNTNRFKSKSLGSSLGTAR